MNATTALNGRRILVVEDDYFGAKTLSELLQAYGAQVVGRIGWVEEAVEFVGNHASAFDVAVLDVNMHGKKSYPIADALLARGKRFIFATGYSGEALDEAYRHYPRCEKPFREN